MIEATTQKRIAHIANRAFRSYAQLYRDIEDDFRAQITTFGLDVAVGDASTDDAPTSGGAPTGKVPSSGAPAISSFSAAGMEAREGLHVDNDHKSFWINWISPSCLTCRKGLGTETFLSSTQCPRNCFFCFNPNQEDYEYYLHHVHDLVGELEERHRRGVRYDDLALTGGEPLLHKEVAYAFFRRASELYPQAYTRLYTSGAGLDEECLRNLQQAGLDEIRFSVKMDEPPAAQALTLERIELAKGFIGTVMVEMPVMPDNLEQMKELLVQLDVLGIAGINLLELCFPLNNASEFAKRGYQIKADQYRVLYDYWYAGGLPIAGSEENCLRLLAFALDERLSLGVHYCSLENKFSGQIYQQNIGSRFKFPYCTMSQSDYFMKSAKVFGTAVHAVRELFESRGMRLYRIDEDCNLLEFPPVYLETLRDEGAEFATIEVGISYYVVEQREGESVLRELRIDVTTPASFDMEVDL